MVQSVLRIVDITGGEIWKQRDFSTAPSRSEPRRADTKGHERKEAMLGRLLVVAAAIQMAADIIGLVVNPIGGIDTLIKTIILTTVLMVTIVWDIGAIAWFGMANPMTGTPPAPVFTERRRRNGMYWSTLAAVGTLGALTLLWLPLGFPFLLLVLGLEGFLLLITVSDGISAYYLLR